MNKIIVPQYKEININIYNNDELVHIKELNMRGLLYNPIYDIRDYLPSQTRNGKIYVCTHLDIRFLAIWQAIYVALYELLTSSKKPNKGDKLKVSIVCNDMNVCHCDDYNTIKECSIELNKDITFKGLNDIENNLYNMAIQFITVPHFFDIQDVAYSIDEVEQLKNYYPRG